MSNLPEKVGNFGSEKDFRSLIIKYFNQEVAGRSHLTIKAKHQDLKKFLLFYESVNGHLNADAWMVRDTKLFIDELERQNYSPASINRILASVRAFGFWVQENGILIVNPCKGIRELQLEPCQPKSVDDLSYHRLKKAAEILIAKPRSLVAQDFRNHALLECLNSSGLRIHEVLGLKLHQIQGKRLVGVRCKGGRIRDVLIKKEAADLIYEYVRNHRTGGSDFLFSNRYGHRLSRNGVAKALDKIAGYASATLSEPLNVTPHRFRHRHAFKCREAKDPVFAARRLGHSSLKYIERYATLSQENEERLIEEI